MNKNQNTKKALRGSLTALFLCVVLLIGTTFAWFTDSVSSGTNVIKSGNLEISATYQDTAATGTTYNIPGFTRNGGNVIFGDTKVDINENNSIISEELWEPGAVGAKLITVKNGGNLAAKIKLDFTTTDNGLQDALWFDFIQVGEDNAVTGAFTEREMSTLSTFAKNLELPLMPKGTEGDSVSFIMLYGMKEDAGNEFKDKSFEADVTILATQYTYEEDSFGTDYDADAEYPYIDNSDGTFSKDGKLYVKAADDFIEVTPYDGVDGLYTDSAGDAYVATKEAVTAVIQSSYDLLENGGYKDAKLTLVKDITIAPDQTRDGYLCMSDSELDLNGKTLTVKTNNQFMVVGNNVTVKNGTIKAGSDNIAYPVAATAGSQNVVFENIVCVGGIQVLGNSTVTLKNVTSTATLYYNIYVAGGNATATIESGTFTDNGKVHFYTEDTNCKVVVNGGEFSGGTPTHNGDGTLTDNR